MTGGSFVFMRESPTGDGARRQLPFFPRLMAPTDSVQESVGAFLLLRKEAESDE